MTYGHLGSVGAMLVWEAAIGDFKGRWHEICAPPQDLTGGRTDHLL